MSSINKILNDALDQTLLKEDVGVKLEAKEEINPEVVDEGVRELVQPVRDATNKGLRYIGSTGETGKAVETNIRDAVTYLKQHKPEALIGGGATAAIGAGVGALLLAKKLRAKKEAAKKKEKK